jgi:phosphate transport system substrate-binding protein
MEDLQMKIRCIARAAASLAALVTASATLAQTNSTVLGGGSSLVAPSITTEIADFGADPYSLTYLSANSNAGQTAFLRDSATYLNPDITGAVDFANSDPALSSAYITSYDNSTFATTDKGGPLIQIPFIVAPVTIPYVNGPTSSTDTFLGPQTTPGQTHSLALNDNDLCGIFSGKLTNWNQVTNADTGSSFSVNATITVVYDASNSSGTTDLLTHHLAAVCSTSNTATGVTFAETQTFTANFPSGFPTGSTFVGLSGSNGVRAELTSLSAAGTAAVGYLAPDYANTFLAPDSTYATAGLAVASVVNSFITNSPLGTADIAPTYPQADAAISASANVPNTKPKAEIPSNWVPDSSNPTAGYPVSGTSQIIFSECYTSADVATSLMNFLVDHYTNATYLSIINGHGLDIPTAYVAAIEADFLSNTSGYNLDINGAECTVGSGR